MNLESLTHALAPCLGLIKMVFDFVSNLYCGKCVIEMLGKLWLLVLYLPSMELHALLALS